MHHSAVWCPLEEICLDFTFHTLFISPGNFDTTGCLQISWTGLKEKYLNSTERILNDETLLLEEFRFGHSYLFSMVFYVCFGKSCQVLTNR